MRTLMVVLSGAAIGCAALSGCSFNFEASSNPVVSKTALQDEISKRLTDAGETPQSVTCKDDLVGEVGKTARCEVVISDTNSFEPIVRVTSVDGSTVNYEMTPALSKEQVEKAVTGLVENAAGLKARSATCESGLEGVVGKTTSCEVDAGVDMTRWGVEVTDVKGLLMNFEIYPVLTKEKIEQSFLDRLAQELGKRPESAVCSEDLVGKAGNTISCDVVAGAETGSFTLTVTGVDGAVINYRFEQTS